MAADPCILHEDSDLLVVHKPAGWNTHAPTPWSGEGIYDYLRNRRPEWASLAIIHRLDKETSGVLAFSKSIEGNRSLTQQFTNRLAHKTYLLVTDRAVGFESKRQESWLRRVGAVQRSMRAGDSGEHAITEFRVLKRESGRVWLEARPATGRTHQIRVHAADLGIPILGDPLYGGGSSHRLHLHASSLEILHPTSGEPLRFSAPDDFECSTSDALRRSIIDPRETNGFRVRHGAADGVSGLYVDRFGDRLLCEVDQERGCVENADIAAVHASQAGTSLWRKDLVRAVRGKSGAVVSPRCLSAPGSTEPVVILENGVRFEIRFDEGYSVGLFLDQRDNRRRLIHGHIAHDFPMDPGGFRNKTLLNLFAYTCGFSVCGAVAGARTTSLDLSRKYLEWGRRNLTLNAQDPATHDFIYGDAFDWAARLTKKGRRFDVVIADPPTFSQSKETGVFRAEKDFAKLACAAAGLAERSGVVLLSTNAAEMEAPEFLAQVRNGVLRAGRRIERQHFAPQPPDFPVTRDEPAYLKTVWLRLD